MLPGMLLVAAASQAAVTARVDRSVVSEQETLRLILESSGQQVQGEPDFSVLRQDFDILGSGKSSHVSIVNGRVDARTEWMVSLAPKRPGRVLIPPIRIGNETSSSLTIEVKAAPDTPVQGDSRDVFLEVQVDDPSPYVQAQVVYTMRLFHAVDLSGSQLTEPEAGHAVVRRIGSDVRYQTRRDGRPYWVLERRYAVFPQAHGKLTIESPLFTGKVPETARGKGAGREGFDMFDRFFQPTRTIRRRGPDVTLDVRLPPAKARGADWLPAKHLTITEAWTPDPPVFRVGEAITRSITLTAWGADEAMLPELSQEPGKSLKSYPEKPIRDSRVQDDNLVGRRVQAVTLVPTEEGRVTLPEVKVRWWDTVHDREQVATLPGRTVTVLPAGAQASKGSGWFGGSPAVPAAGAPVDRQVVPAAPTDATGAGVASYWPWLLAAALSAGWLLTLWLWWRDRHPAFARRRRRRPAAAAAPQHLSERAARHALEAACHASDARGARDALLAWAKTRWTDAPPMTLMEAADKLAEPVASPAIADLDRAIYTNQDAAWNGVHFWELVSPALGRPAPREKPDRDDAALPRLSPLS
jgi:hypothetical protein